MYLHMNDDDDHDDHNNDHHDDHNDDHHDDDGVDYDDDWMCVYILISPHSYI